MQTIEGRVQIGHDRRLSMQLPVDIVAGKYEVVLVLNQRAAAVSAGESGAMQKIQALLKQSVPPGHSLADELIQERRAAVERIEDYCLNQAMDEARETPLLFREAALSFLEED